MSQEPLVSSKKLIAELIIDYNIQGTDWLGSIQRHIARGMELMRLDGYFVRKAVKARLINNMVVLPCDNKYLIGAVVIGESTITRLPIKTGFTLGTFLSNLAINTYAQAEVQGNHLVTNLQDGGLLGLIYYGPPLDKEGNPMIIDNPFVLEALPFFIINKLSFSGYKHSVISREEAEDKWNKLSITARNDVNFPSLEDMESFTQAMTNPYYEYILGQEFLGIGNP